ncbi:MAG: methyltransferase domain-containing protein [Pseudomonadota bacterium]
MTTKKNGDKKLENKAEALLQGAYALQSAEDNIDYYREFAPVYDQQFAQALRYTYPYAVAKAYLTHAQARDIPVLDVGCGTGLVAQALGDFGPVDGVDISAEMIAVASGKSLYRHLYQQDLTLGSMSIGNDYAGVVSAGTFTHGHLGPEVVELLLDVGRHECLYCLGINAVHYEESGFAPMFDRLCQSGAVSGLQQSFHPIFSGGDSDHAHDKALVVTFRKC